MTIATEWNGPRVPYVAALDDQVQSGKDALEQIRVDAEDLSTVRNDGVWIIKVSSTVLLLHWKFVKWK
jgi:hypothetical protein